MKPYFSNPERIAALVATAQAWQGTPFRANSCVRGVGLSCQFAPAVCLRGAGFELPEIPKGPTSWARYQTRSLQEEWLDGHPELFAPLSTINSQLSTLLAPGDVVGFKAGKCVHHLGIILPDNKFFQCYEVGGATILSVEEQAFKKRLARGWRPIEP